MANYRDQRPMLLSNDFEQRKPRACRLTTAFQRGGIASVVNHWSGFVSVAGPSTVNPKLQIMEPQALLTFAFNRYMIDSNRQIHLGL